MKLRSAKTAPKNGSAFLAHVGMPWLVMCSWNECSQQWVWADLQVEPCNGEADTYFQNEYDLEDALIGWLPLPEIPEEKRK